MSRRSARFLEDRLPYQNPDMAFPVLVHPIHPTPYQEEAVFLAMKATSDNTIHPNWTNPQTWEMIAKEFAARERKNGRAP